MVENHLHNGTDSPRLDAKRALINAPQSATTALTGNTADTTYSSNEQAMLNNHETILSELVAKLTNLGLIR